MNFQLRKSLIGTLITAAVISSPAQAALTLTVIDSVNVSSAFGLAFDGSNIWYEDGFRNVGKIDQNAPGMTVLNPNVFSAPVWSAMAWDGSNLAFAQGNTLYKYSTSGISQGNLTLGRSAGLIDGLDIEGGKIYWSPDISYAAALNLATGLDDPGIILNPAGGLSGIERVISGANDWLFVVNDASNPRTICRTNTNSPDANFPAGECVALPNSRYEDLAFDGRYLYAADYYGGRIDKIDLQIDGSSIFDPGNKIPEPSTLALLGIGILGFGIKRQKKS